VLGEKKRTLKLLVAIAHGAWVLTPAWCMASLEAGRWLPEEPYESLEFPGARRSRQVCRCVWLHLLLPPTFVSAYEPRRSLQLSPIHFSFAPH
jgi:hypothetical protein